MDLASAGKLICLVGASLLALGGLVLLASRCGLPLGSLPGDLHIRRPGMTLVVPLTTSLLASVVLTLLGNLVLRLLRR